jgi:arginyl-tRNA synthetase
MTFRLLVNEARRVIADAVSSMGCQVPDFSISEPPKEFGDLSCNIAFQLAKQLRRRPFEIATQIINIHLKPYLEAHPESLISSVEPHQAGYINFRANYQRLASNTLREALQNPRYGYPNVGQGLHTIIEHTSVNPNKALHVGHMRNAILGDTLHRIMKATNHHVTVLNYVDDSGLQVADIVVALKFAGFAAKSPDGVKFDQYCGELYVKINDIYEVNPLLAEKRKLVLQNIEEGKSELAAFASEITRRILEEQLKTCWRMKVRYDLLNFESQIVVSQMWARSFELLKKSGLAVFETEGKNRGCWVIKAHEGGEDDKVLVRSDGTATYMAKDIPYAAWKLGLVEDPFSYYRFTVQWDGSTLWATTLDKKADDSIQGNPNFNSGEQVITIIDSRQARLQKIISWVLSQLTGGSHNQNQNQNYHYYHLGYEAVTLSSETAKSLGMDIGDKQFMHMSGRKGLFVNADYIMDNLRSKAHEEVKTRNPSWPDEQVQRTAEEIAISAIRYNMVRQDLDKIITFDIKESLSLEGDTGPYLQYAYARSQRILEKSANPAVYNPSFGMEEQFAALISEYEITLVKEIARLDMVVEEAAKSLSPKSVARYAYSLATVFNLFYEKVPVLKESDSDIMRARLALVKAFGLTLRNAMALIGVTPLEKM